MPSISEQAHTSVTASGARSFETRLGAQALTGLRAGVGGAEGLVVALHGGGYDARYWHTCDADPASLLAHGARLGFEVLALDRPGYRGSATPDPAGLPLAAQAALVFRLIEEVAPDPSRPVYLIGHSMGGILAVTMAADARGSRLSGIDVSGVPLRYPEAMRPIIEQAIRATREPHRAQPLNAQPSNAQPSNAQGRRWMFYGEEGSFDPRLFDLTPGDNPMPSAEMMDAFSAPISLPPLMSRIAVPVQWTIADQERTSEGGPEMLAHVRTLMAACPRLVTTLQVASGHNISLHHVARAYHLRALAFFEECRLQAAGRAGTKAVAADG